MIVRLPADRVDEARPVRVALHRHHAAIDVPAGWATRDEDRAYAAWRARTVGVLGEGGELFAHSSSEGIDGIDGIALVTMLGGAELVRPVLEADGPHAELLTLSVLPEARSAGIGARLYAAASQWAREHGAVVMHVDTRADNHDGLRFYARQGARPAFVQLMQPL